MSEKERIIHLLIPKEYRVWCVTDRSPKNLEVTNRASKATCANCLSIMRSKTQKRYRRFRVSHIPQRKLQWDE